MLTPFKVRQMASTIDEYVYDGTDNVIAGDIEASETFTEGDFNTRIIIQERELTGGVIVESKANQKTKRCDCKGSSPSWINAGPATETQMT